MNTFKLAFSYNQVAWCFVLLKSFQLYRILSYVHIAQTVVGFVNIRSFYGPNTSLTLQKKIKGDARRDSQLLI